jgi:hypothetical protein
MVSGEDAHSVIMMNYRLVASIVPSSSTESDISVPIPQTDYEQSVNSSSSSLTVTSATSGSSVSVTSLPLHILGYNYSYVGSNVSSTVLRVSSSNASNGSFIFTFAHYQPEIFGVDDTLNGNVTVTTQCIGGKAVVPYAMCPFGIVVPVQCNGTYGSYIRTVCPSKMRLPSCKLVTDLNEEADCEVADYNASVTTCRCHSSLFASKNRVNDRRLGSSSSSMGLVEARNVVALASYSFTEYVSVMESASRFDSLDALKSSSLVSLTFALLWFGTVFVILGAEQFKRYHRQSKSKKLARISAAPLIERAHSENRRHQHGDSGTTSLEETLQEYIKELFSPAFSDYSGTARLFQELWNKHQYLSVLALEYGPQQWVGAFYLLTNLTANFFMLALFYDIEFPSNDGTCSLLSTETTCLAPRSMFNAERTKCYWSSDDAICTWRRVRFDAFSTVVISVLVLLVSVPVSFLISYTCEMILLAPSVNDVKAQDRKNAANMTVRRKSAVDLLNAAAVQNERRKASTAVDISNALKERKRHVTVFSAVNDMDTSVKRATVRAHQLSRGTIIRNKLDDSTNSRNFKSFPCFVQDLRDFGHHTIDTGKETPLLMGHQRLSVNITKKIIDEFLAFWNPLLDDADPNAVAVLSSAHGELTSVLMSASEYIEKLRSLPPEEAGVYILELFVRDCLGRNSREAIIFSQKVHPLKSKYVLTAGMKCFTFACMLMLNMYFIFACMLYAADKGAHWRFGWLYNCIINLFVDICVNSVSMASVIYYFVPNLIVDKARHAKATVNRIIHQLCENHNEKQSTNGKMSATAYYFVSMHVARAFPDLLESRIVLGYNSFFVSRDQSLKINPFYWERQRDHRSRIVQHSMSVGWQSAIAGYVSLLSTWLTTSLLIFGSQSITVQQAVISVGNPGLVAGIAFIGIYLFKGSFVGIPLGAVVVVPVLVGVFLTVRYFRNRARRDIRDLDDHKNLAMYESELYARQVVTTKHFPNYKVAAEVSEVPMVTPGEGTNTDASVDDASVRIRGNEEAIDIFSMLLSVIEESSDDERNGDEEESSGRSTTRSASAASGVEELAVVMRPRLSLRSQRCSGRFDLDGCSEKTDKREHAPRSVATCQPSMGMWKADLNNSVRDDLEDVDSSSTDSSIVDLSLANISDTGSSEEATTNSASSMEGTKRRSHHLDSNRMAAPLEALQGTNSDADLDFIRYLVLEPADSITPRSCRNIVPAGDSSNEDTSSDDDLDRLRALIQRPRFDDARCESTAAEQHHRMQLDHFGDTDSHEFSYDRFDDDWNEIKRVCNETVERADGNHRSDYAASSYSSDDSAAKIDEIKEICNR